MNTATPEARLAEIRASVAGDAAAPPGYDISPSDLAERADLLAMVDAARRELDEARAECGELRAQLSAAMSGDGGRMP